MKKNNKKPVKRSTTYQAREPWRCAITTEVEIFIDNLQAVEGLPEDKLNEIIELVKDLKRELHTTVEGLDITPEIIDADRDLLPAIFEGIRDYKIAVSENDIDDMQYIVERNQTGTGGVFVQIENLAQQIRLEEFMEDLKENPCQLKLIA